MECTRIYSIHDHAITFEFSNTISEAVNVHVIKLRDFIVQHPFDGFIESVPAYNTLTVYFNKTVNKNEVIHILTSYNKQLSTFIHQTQTDIKIIPVCYELGADFSNICTWLNIKSDELIHLHSAITYRVYMIGFTPGFPYMGTLPKQLQIPRKKNPSLHIEEGSVAIAGAQTGIYPRNSPGGWHIIGKTPVKIYDKKRNPACFLQAGNLVNFKPISKEVFDQYP